LKLHQLPSVTRRGAGTEEELYEPSRSAAGWGRHPSLEELKAKGRASEIPKMAHFVWMGRDTQPEQLASIVDFKKKNPEYLVMLWVDRKQTVINSLLKYDLSLDKHLEKIRVSDIGEFFLLRANGQYEQSQAVHQAFLRERHGVYANLAASKDILSLALMEVFGGIFLDMDVAVLQKLSFPPSEKGAFFRVVKRGELDFMTNGVMAATPRNSLILEAIRHAVAPYEGSPLQYNTSSFWRTLKMHYNIPPSASGDQKKAIHELFWGAKRSDPDSRFNLTVQATGPGSLDFALAGRFCLFGASSGVQTHFPRQAEVFGHLDTNANRTCLPDVDSRAQSWRSTSNMARRTSI